MGANWRLGAYSNKYGIPAALEQDCYFDVNKRNLIVFGDQMIDARKEKRIVNFFSRGSHHRNLSMIYRVFSHDVTAAIMVSLDNETAAMLVSQNGPVGVELFSYANAFFSSNKFA